MRNINEEECKYDNQHVDREDLIKLELTEDRSYGFRSWHDSFELSHAKRNTDDHSDDDSQKYCSRHFAGIQETGNDQADKSKQSGTGGYVSKGYKSGSIINYDSFTLAVDVNTESNPLNISFSV